MIQNPLSDDREDIILGDDLVFLAVDFYFSAAVTAGENDIAHLDIKFNLLTVVIGLAGAEGDYFIFLRFSLAVSGIKMPPFI